MYYFTIKDIETLSGIKAHTLRIWEQRYQLLTPKRKGSNHRLYTNEDLKKLLRISILYHQGWKISQIALLDTAQLLEETRKIDPAPTDYGYHIAQLMEPALDFDKETFLERMERVITAMGFEAGIVQVCYPLMKKIGQMWMTERLIPAQEHFCTYIIQHKIIAETDKLPPPQREAPEILLFCPHGEYHDLALHFINYLLRKSGWTSVFLGTDVTLEFLKPFTMHQSLTHLFLHITVNFTGFGLDDYFERLCKAFPDKRIVASGAAIFTVQRAFTNLTLLKSDDEIHRFVKKESGYLTVT
jgi:DNA-binding transcriptional MerR regulator